MVTANGKIKDLASSLRHAMIEIRTSCCRWPTRNPSGSRRGSSPASPATTRPCLAPWQSRCFRAASIDRRSEEQFMAEVGTIGRTHHINLVRLLGFCFDAKVRALVYEYMENGSLDAYLFDQSNAVGLPTLRDIAVGVARGLRYLHEECQRKIIHYDIKAGNILLDGGLTPKVSCPRGTPGYTAPEMWMQSGITEKCDVYSFGMLLLELVGRRRNFDEAATSETQQWFPMVAWTKYESGALMELPALRVDYHDVAAAQHCSELMERICKVAFWCVQQQPGARPPIGAVVKMLEGEMAIAPPANPFQHLMASASVTNLWMTTASSVGSESVLANGSNEIIISL